MHFYYDPHVKKHLFFYITIPLGLLKGDAVWSVTQELNILCRLISEEVMLE